MRKIMMRFTFLIVLVSLSLFIVGCGRNDGDDPINRNSEVVSIDTVMKKMNVKSSSNRKIVEYGYSNDELYIIYDLGTVTESFMGFLTPTVSHSGAGKIELECSFSEISATAQTNSTTVLEQITNTVGGSISFDIKPIKAGLEFNYSNSKTRGIEETYGYTISEELQKGGSVRYELNSGHEIGRYVIVGTANYSIFQITSLDPFSRNIISNHVFYTVNKYEPAINTYLVKSDENLKFEDVVNKLTPQLPIVDSPTNDEIASCLNFLSLNSNQSINIVKIIDNNVESKKHSGSGNSSYKDADTFEVEKDIKFNFTHLKALGYKKLRIEFDFYVNGSTSCDANFKWVDDKGNGLAEEKNKYVDGSGWHLCETSFEISIDNLLDAKSIKLQIGTHLDSYSLFEHWWVLGNREFIFMPIKG